MFALIIQFSSQSTQAFDGWKTSSLSRSDSISPKYAFKMVHINHFVFCSIIRFISHFDTDKVRTTIAFRILERFVFKLRI